MCGIGGFYANYDLNPTESNQIINSLAQKLHHRGPDSRDSYYDSEIILLQTRLAIIGTANGAQPLYNFTLQPMSTVVNDTLKSKNSSKRYAQSVFLEKKPSNYSPDIDSVHVPKTMVIANGEIYNYKDLKELFANYSYYSDSDCEVILPLYDQYGLDFTHHLRGMYAIALYDLERKNLILARDPFGIKPLYYRLTGAGVFFSSEIDPLLKPLTFSASPPSSSSSSGIKLVSSDGMTLDSKINTKLNIDVQSLNQDKIYELLHCRYTIGSNSIWNNIYRVNPGETIIINQGRVAGKRDRSVWSANGSSSGSFSRSLGGSSSTGYSSGFLSASAAATKNLSTSSALRKLDDLLHDSVHLHMQSEREVGLFLSSGIDSVCILQAMSRFSERPINTFTVRFREGDGATEGAPSLKRKAEKYDEGEIATQIAEQFGCDHTNIDFTSDDWWRLLPLVASCLDDPLVDYSALPTYKMAEVAKNKVTVVLCGEGGDEFFAGYRRYQKLRLWFSSSEGRRSAFDDLKILKRDYPYHKAYKLQADSIKHPQSSKMQFMQAMDINTWLANDLLPKLDRCLMAHGLEGRVPFVDRDLGMFGYNLPDYLKAGLLQGKVLLRKWAEINVKNYDPYRKKRGFNVPILPWFKARSEEIASLLVRHSAIQEICYTDQLEVLFANLNKKNILAAWTLLFYAVWHSVHVKEQTPEEDVFKFLSKSV